MHLTRHAVTKVGGGTESLQKLFRERGPVMKQHASIWGDNIARFRISFVSPVLQIAVLVSFHVSSPPTDFSTSTLRCGGDISRGKTR